MATTTSVVSVGAFVKVAPGRLKCWRLELIVLRDRSDTIDDPNVPAGTGTDVNTSTEPPDTSSLLRFFPESGTYAVRLFLGIAVMETLTTVI